MWAGYQTSYHACGLGIRPHIMHVGWVSDLISCMWAGYQTSYHACGLGIRPHIMHIRSYIMHVGLLLNVMHVGGVRAGERSGVTYPGPQGIIGTPRSKIVLFYG